MRLTGLGSPLGRAAETATLERAIGEAVGGGKRAVLLRGAPGMGKTTLLYWALELARASGLLCGIARTPAAGGLPPRFPLPELLGTVGRSIQERSMLPPQLLNETVAALRGDVPTQVRPPDLLQVASALEETTRLAPVALMLDDLQWTPREESSLLLAALRIADAPLLLVATARHESPEPLWIDSGADLPVDVLDLDGLAADSIAELASRALDAPVLPSLAGSLYERTLGNPLFVLETIREWRDSRQIGVVAGGYWGFIEGTEHHDSRSLREVIAGRLRAMPAEPLALAQSLAVLGRAASLDELKRIVDVSADTVVEHLARLEDEGMVVHEDAVGHRISHPLFQAALLSDMKRTREAAVHGRIHAVLSEDLPRRTSAEVAYHAVRALEPPDDLLDLLGSAATEAERAGSYADAADWYHRLVENAPNDDVLLRALRGRAAALEHFNADEAAEIYGQALALASEGHERGRLLLGRARSLRMAGNPTEALQDLKHATQVAAPEDLPEIRHTVAVVHGAQGRIEVAVELLKELADETKGTPVHAKAVGHLAIGAYIRGNPDEASLLSEEALKECDDPGYKDYLHMNQSWFLTIVGKWDTAETMVEASINRATRAHDTWLLTALLSTATLLYAWKGNSERAVDLATQGLRLAAHGSAMDQVLMRGALASALLEEGQSDEAFRLVSDVLPLFEQTWDRNDLQAALIATGEAYLARGDITKVQDVIDLTRLMIEQNLTWKVALDRLTAQLELAKHRPETAIGITERYMKEPSRFRFEQASITEVAARAWAASGQTAMARNRAEKALEEYERLGAVRRAQRVRAWIAEQEPRRIGRPRSSSPTELTERENEILRLVAQSKTNSEIARELVISPGTVKKHVENIKAKLGVSRRTQLVEFALRSETANID